MKLALRVKLTLRIKSPLRAKSTLRAKSALRVKLTLCVKLALRVRPTRVWAPWRMGDGGSEPMRNLKLLHTEASLHRKTQCKPQIWRLRAPSR